jgi:F-box protein 39
MYFINFDVVFLIFTFLSIHCQVIREKISTATVLLVAKSAINLQFFTVRKNAVILRCDWPKNPEWTTDFYDWLRMASKSYEATEREVSQLLGYRWTMLPDKLFKQISVNVRNVD